LNKEKLIHFKDLVENECRQMARIMRHQTSSSFEQKLNEFYKDMEAAFLDAYSHVQNKYLGRLLDIRKLGKKIDASTQ